MLEPRRPSPARLVGFALLLGLTSWGLGALAAWPWPASDPGAAVLRVAFKHVAAFEEAAPARSAEELARLPRHMRPTAPEGARTGRRVDTTLTVVVDGRTLLDRRYRPGGLRHDGPTFGYEELAVSPGRRTVEVVLADAPAAGRTPRRWQLRQELDIRPGQAPLVELSEASGLTLR
jgi:hypothetical protein